MKFLGTAISYALILAVVIGLLALQVLQQIGASGPLEQEKTVIIERGMSVSRIATKLETEGVIGSPLLFRIAAQLLASPAGLKAGEYQFEPEMSLTEVVGLLDSGAVVTHSFTVPEGLTSAQIINLLNNIENLDGDLSEAAEVRPAEGTLLPETYSYTRGDARTAKLERMRIAMDAFLEEAWQNRADNLPIDTKEEALILASIVEKETSIFEEQPKVAGVFINRLRQGMKLQSDPTVIYAMTSGVPEDGGYGPIGRQLLRSDWEYESPYNTYKYAGLPPGPIAHPGKNAIRAVLRPAVHDYIFFVADGTGGHAFARTLNEHNRNVAAWRRIRDQNRLSPPSEASGNTDIPKFEGFEAE